MGRFGMTGSRQPPAGSAAATAAAFGGAAATNETLGQNGSAQTTASTANSSITVQAIKMRCAG